MARFFLFLLGVAALAVGAANAYLAVAEHEKIVGRHAADLLSASARSLPLALAADADLDVARGVAQRTPFQFALADLAIQGSVPDRSILQAASRSVRSLSEAEEPVVVVGTKGGIRALVGKEVVEVEGEAAAIVASALEGSERQGLVSIEGKLHRLRAVPVSTGALGVALPVDDAYARALSERLGVDLTFLHRGKAVASTLGAMERAELAVASSGGGKIFGTGGRPAEYTVFEVLELPLFAKWAGTTRAHSQELGEATILHSTSARPILDPLVELQKRSLLLSALVAVIAFFFALVGGSGKRQLRELAQLADVAERVAEGDPKAALPVQLAGEVGRLARAIERLAKARRPGAVETALAEPGFGAEPESGSVDDLVAAFPFPGEPTAPEPGAGEATEAERSEPSIPEGFAPVADLPATEPAEFGAAESTADAEPPEGFDPSALGGFEPPGPAELQAADASAAAAPEGFDPSPLAGIAPAASAVPPPLPGFTMDHPEGEEAGPAPGDGADTTSPWDMPTRPLPFLQTKEPEAPPTSEPEAEPAAVLAELEPPTEPEDPEEAHLREVYEQFLQVRQQCGESSAGISFDRFSAKLRATRAQLMEKHRAASVRFTVYVKNGKAALKASPVGVHRAS
jgi:HAMP domain-containing protein